MCAAQTQGTCLRNNVPRHHAMLKKQMHAAKPIVCTTCQVLACNLFQLLLASGCHQQCQTRLLLQVNSYDN
eukprot:5552006-Amphidinium_carterae.2